MKNNQLLRLLEIFLVSVRLGCTSFGGPIAHLAYFHEEYVRRRKWIDEKTYVDLVALAQLLPGPASSQVGIGIGVMRAGVLGGVVSFIGFTLPSVVVLILFASVLLNVDVVTTGWIHGLKIVAVVVVAHAIVGMAKNLTPDLKTKALALFALVCTLLWQVTGMQIVVILVAAAVGFFLFKNAQQTTVSTSTVQVTKRVGIVCLSMFFGLLIILPVIREVTDSYWISMIDSFYRSGSLVFGGGHVVLPLLEQEFVSNGWIGEENFLAGYGATQAVPGPLFTFAAYIGAVMNGWQGGLVATVAIFLPAFLLVVGTLPFWDHLRNQSKILGVIKGVNAAVVGILISALYFPIWTHSILSPMDFALAAVLFSMLAFWKWPPWIIVMSGIVGGLLLSFFS